ncbi:MAG: hypothetical protein ACREQR_11110 [Candidatus Binataceae bacterium]
MRKLRVAAADVSNPALDFSAMASHDCSRPKFELIKFGFIPGVDEQRNDQREPFAFV